MIRTVAEERRKSRRFDEDRRAYGHIRRFIERHAGGRPAEWDAEDGQEVRSSDGFERCAGVGIADRARRVAGDLYSGRKEAEEENLGLHNVSRPLELLAFFSRF